MKCTEYLMKGECVFLYFVNIRILQIIVWFYGENREIVTLEYIEEKGNCYRILHNIASTKFLMESILTFDIKLN